MWEAIERRRVLFRRIARKEGKVGINIETRVRTLERQKKKVFQSITDAVLEEELKWQIKMPAKDVMKSILDIMTD